MSKRSPFPTPSVASATRMARQAAMDKIYALDQEDGDPFAAPPDKALYRRKDDAALRDDINAGLAQVKAGKARPFSVDRIVRAGRRIVAKKR